MQQVTTKFTLRKDYKHAKTGQTSIYFTVTTNNSQTRFVLPLNVYPDNWNTSKQRISKKEFDYLDKNNMLDFYDAQAKTYIADCQIKKKSFCIEDLKASLFGKKSSDDYFEFVKQEIEADATLSHETRRTYFSKLNKLRSFRENLSISDIDYHVLMAYKNWMIKKGDEENTYNKDLSIIKSFLNRAVKKGLIEKHDFDKIKIRSVEGNREFLTSEELQKLRKLHTENNNLSEPLKAVLHLFLFTCYTGLRYRDLKGFMFGHIKENFIVMKMHKTQKLVEIPLIDEAMKLIPTEKKSDKENVFRVFSNQVFNRYLKELASIADINKTVTHHCARHTFATLAFSNGMKIEVISKILGHSSTKVTQIYAKILQTQKVESMDAFNNFLITL